MKRLNDFLIIFVCLFIVQIAFFYMQISYERSVVLSIQALVNQEAVASNPYMIAQGLENLESIGLIRCSKLSSKQRKVIYIDTSFKGECETSFWKLNGRNLNLEVKSINGGFWSVNVVSNNNNVFNLMLWIVRILFVALGLTVYKLYCWRMKSLNLKVSSALEISKIAAQVSHDIRSPLSALKMALGDLESVPIDQRSMIRNSLQRINDIANNLLRSNNETKRNESFLEEENLFLVLDSLISEKRMQFNNIKSLNFEIKFTADPCLFIKINKVEFYRALSNIVNNSVEAIKNNGKICIYVESSDLENVCIRVEDSGIGMPLHVVSKLGERGFSHGKQGTESGSGLGVSHAKETVESFGGRFKIESLEGIGTTIIIFFPIVQQPLWFGGSIIISANKRIFILDDDENIFLMWKKKLDGLIHYDSSLEEFSQKIGSQTDKNILCLIDYELRGQDETGLDIIEELDLFKVSFLVTSHYEEREIRERCRKNGVRIIPKPLLEWVTVKTFNDESIFHHILIDDDKIMRISWERAAKNKKINLLTLQSTTEFNKYANQISKENTFIYIDSDLGKNEVRGEEFAKKLHEQGYKKIFITSGYDAENFSDIPWAGIIGKYCPF